MSSAKFSVGNFVEWTSQSAGTWKRKVGVVVEVVPPRQEPKMRPAGSGWGCARRETSYVIEVSEAKARGGERRRLYWPLASKLELVEQKCGPYATGAMRPVTTGAK